jgi:hypothetical protein
MEEAKPDTIHRVQDGYQPHSSIGSGYQPVSAIQAANGAVKIVPPTGGTGARTITLKAVTPPESKK